MFRIIIEEDIGWYYLEKKFLWFWIKWAVSKTNLHQDIRSVVHAVENGHYEFTGGQCGHYWIIMDTGEYRTFEFRTLSELKEEYAEYLI